MKKYFISFRYSKKDGETGFANTIKTSLNNINLKQIDEWEEEIRSSQLCEKAVILFFKGVK